VLAVVQYLLPAGLWETVSVHFTPVQPQGPGADIAKLMAGVGTFCFMGKKQDTEDVINEVYRRIGNFDKTSSGIESLLEFVKESLMKLIRFFQMRFSKDKERFLESIQNPLDKWMSQIDYYDALLGTNSADPTPEILDKLVILCQDGSTFKECFRHSPVMSRRVEDYFRKAKMLLAPHLGSLGARNNYRVEPEMGMLYGGPAIGKTLLVGRMASSILIRSGLCTDKNVQNNIWQKGTSQYWNSYCKQKCVIFDDAFQKKANPSDPDSEYMDIIRMIGSWSFPLNMADVESKGRSFFGSSLVLGTTNVSSILADCEKIVQSPEAVVRRIKHGYRVKVSPEYALESNSERLDYQKFYVALNKRMANADEATSADDIFPWDAWTFYAHNFLTGMTSPEPIDPKVAVARISDALRDKHQQHQGDRDIIAELDKRTYVHNAVRYRVNPQLGGSTVMSVPVEEHFGTDNIVLDGIAGVKLEGVERYTDYEEGYCSASEDDFSDAPTTPPNHPAGYKPRVSPLTDSVVRNAVFNFDEEDNIPIAQDSVWNTRVGHWVNTNGDIVTYEDPSVDSPTISRMRIRTRAAFSDYMDTFRGYCKRFSAFLCENKWYIAGAVVSSIVLASLVGACMGIWSFIKSLFSKKEVTEETTTEAQVVSQSNRPLTKPVMASGTQVRFQSIGDVIKQHDDTAVHDTVYSNTYKMWMYQPVAESPNQFTPIILGQVCFLNGTMAVMPYHFITYLKTQDESAKLRLRSGTNVELTYGKYDELSVKLLLKLPRHDLQKHDLTFINFQRLGIRAHSTVSQHLLREDQVKTLKSAPKAIRLDVSRVDAEGAISKKNGRMIYVAHTSSYLDTLLSGKDTIHGVWEYTAPTMEGDCGAPLTLLNPAGVGKTFIGIHVAGDGNSLGYSSVITFEMFEKARKALGTFLDSMWSVEKQCGRVINELVEAEKPAAFNSGSFTVIGRVAVGTHSNPYTSIKPTSLYGIMGPAVDKPVPLSPYMKNGVTVLPMLNALEANKSDVRIIDHQDPIWVQAMHVAGKLFTQRTAGCSRRVLSFEEAVLGDPTLKLKAINRKSSAGYPYVLDKRSGKKEFFGTGDDYDLTTKGCVELKADVEKLIYDARQGVRPSVIYNDFLKDERRSPEKVEAGMARMISSSPLHYTVPVRMYFGNILSAMFSNCVETGLAPGMCTYQDWGLLATRLSKFGEAVFDGDFKRFDSTQQPGLLYVIRDWINKWYGGTEEETRIRNVLFEDLVHSRHINGTLIYQWNKCLPSGNPLTTLINSLFSLLMLVYAYIKLTGDATGFWDHCFANSFGDDNIVNVDQCMVEKFNLLTVQECLAELGMTYTAGSKEATDRPYMTLDQCTFLKRGFRYDETVRQWLCPLALNSFLQTFYWCKNPMFYYGTIISDIENAFQELSMWPQDVWDKYAPQLRLALRRHDKAVDTQAPVERECYLRIVLSRTDWY
jgi:hypothetical protein